MIGKTLSHYKVLEKIGQGGMGTIYRAQDTTLDREVAIKVLPEQFTQDPQRLARFERLRRSLITAATSAFPWTTKLCFSPNNEYPFSCSDLGLGLHLVPTNQGFFYYLRCSSYVILCRFWD